MQSCSTEETLMQNETTIKTVSKQEAIQFLQNSNGLNGTKSKSTNVPLVFDFEKITQEKTSHKEALITVIPAQSDIKDKKIRVILWKVDNTIESIVYNEYASESSTINSFTGIIIMKRLNGDFIRAYKLKNNNYVIDLLPIKKDATSKSSNSFGEEPIGLHEVIVINNFKKTSYNFVPMIDRNKSVSDVEDYYWLKSGGGGGYTGAEPVVEEDPCAQIKGLLDYNSTESINLKSNINWLKDKVNAAVNNKEAGVEVKKVMNADETFKYEFNQVLSNDQFSIKMLVGRSYIGAMHSHPSDGDAMFSFQDIRYLLSVFDEAYPSRQQEAFHGLVCKDAAGNTNVYMLKIENIESLRTQINSVWSSEKYSVFQTEKDRIEAIHLDQANKYSKSNGNLEKSFLEQFKDFGIVLFKADATTDHFDKLTLNNSTVTPTPCN
jgi:hypothetical protein